MKKYKNVTILFIMIFRYPEDDTEIALTSKGLKYKGKNEPYNNLMQLYVYNLPYYYFSVNKLCTLLHN